MFITDGKIIIHDLNNPDHLEEAVEKVQNFLLEEKALEVTFEQNETMGYPAYDVPDHVKFTDMEVALRPNLALRAINEDVLFNPEPVDVNTRYVYTEEDMTDIAQQLAKAILDQHKVEAEKKQATGEFNKAIAKLQAKIDAHAQNHTQGYEYRDYKAVLKLDFKEKMKYYLDADDRSKIIKTEPMEGKDFQLHINHTPEALYKHDMQVNDDDEEEEEEAEKENVI